MNKNCKTCGREHANALDAKVCCPLNPKTQQVGGSHYLTKVQPWDLMKEMKTSGNAFVDNARCNAIKYSFRKKADMLEDLKKARHYLDAAIEHIEKNPLPA